MRHRTLAALVASALISTGCATWFDPPEKTHRASVVDYLYPQNERPALKPTVPELHLPLRVGIAFVPGDLRGDLPEVERNNLLNRVKSAFSNRPYIDSIQVIPTTYLRSRGGFGNLEQAARMFNVDVVVLLSYDQMQFSDNNRLSVFYWTIVGGYLVNGSQYDVSTLVDASVFDVASRQLLFRAPGTSQLKGSSPLVKFGEASREARTEGYRQAVDALIPQLDAQLEAFRQRVKEQNAARIIHTSRSSGGDGGLAGLGLFGATAAVAIYRRRAS